MFFPPRRHSEKNLVYSGGTSHPIRFRTVCESLSTAWKECPVSSKNDSEVSGKPKRGVSRRGFIRGAGIGGGVLSAGILDKKALAAPAAADKFVGPGAVPITLKINGKPIKPVPHEELRREIDLFCELFARPAVEPGLRKFV